MCSHKFCVETKKLSYWRVYSNVKTPLKKKDSKIGSLILSIDIFKTPVVLSFFFSPLITNGAEICRASCYNRGDRRKAWKMVEYFFSLLHPAVRENYIQLPSLFFFCLKKKSFLIDFWPFFLKFPVKYNFLVTPIISSFFFPRPEMFVMRKKSKKHNQSWERWWKHCRSYYYFPLNNNITAH